MKTCPKCYNKFEEIYNFCLEDGTPLNQTTTETDNDSGSEQETIVSLPPPPPVTEKTLVMDTSPSSGEETVGFDQPPSVVEKSEVTENLPLRDDGIYQQTQSEEERGYVWVDEATNLEESVDSKEDEQDNPNYLAPFVAESSQTTAAQNRTSQSSQSVPNLENKKSYLGIIIGGIGLFALLLLGTGLLGAYLYFQSSKSDTENVAADTNQDANSETNLSTDETIFDLPTKNRDIKPENSNQKDRGKDKTRIPTTQNTPGETTATPKDSRATQDPTKTPISSPTRTPKTMRTPPPRRTPPRGPSRISRGVLNGKATSLPKPSYPPEATAANVKGSVKVAVVISKTGKVLSARAVKGHRLLRNAAVSAARRARFAPTRLGGQTIEVSGVIVYNFR